MVLEMEAGHLSELQMRGRFGGHREEVIVKRLML
jgi:hypothetical protein